MLHLENVSEVGVDILGLSAHTSVGSELGVGNTVLLVAALVGHVHLLGQRYAPNRR